MDILTSENITIVVRLLLATAFGGIVGYERERREMPAGFRTYVLVCIGATLAMLTNEYAINHFGGNIDVTRMGAQVISGMGFLGAGTIIVTHNNHVRGLTTAAGLWTVGCIGLAVGMGAYLAAVVCTIIVFVTMSMLDKVDKKAQSTSKVIEIFVEFKRPSDIGIFLERMEKKSIHVYFLQIHRNGSIEAEDTVAQMKLKYPEKKAHHEMLEDIRSYEEVRYVREISQSF